MSVTISDVENYSATNWQQLDASVKSELLEHAESLMDNQFSERISTLPNFEGNRDDGLKLLTSHLWDLSQGGEATSESADGGSVTYNTVTGETLDSLTETRYGRQFKDLYLRDRQGIGVVRSR
jgi:hypothetical protein